MNKGYELPKHIYYKKSGRIAALDSTLTAIKPAEMMR